MADVIAGRYALLDPVGRGGTGTLWRARDERTGALCAVKLMRQRDATDLQRLIREAGASFVHPHLLAPTGWAVEDDAVAIAMPLVDGGTLEELLRRRGPLAENAVLAVLRQLLSGLERVHAEGWVHRDVKPANVLLDATGSGPPRLRLGDFGIAVPREAVRFTQAGMVNGTRGFLPPEVFSLADPEPSHDVYAAGVLALIALNGPRSVRPGDGAIPEDRLREWLRPTSPELAQALRGMVASDPTRRVPSARAALDLLPPPRGPLCFADGSPLEVPDVLPPMPDAPAPDPAPADPAPDAPAHGGTSRPVGARPLALALAACAGIAVTTGIVLLMRDGPAPPNDPAQSPPASEQPWPVVRDGEPCPSADRGRIGVTASEEYLSCMPDADGTLAYR